MTNPIVIIGSGFAAYQLVKAIRRIDNTIPIDVFTADEGHDYNKPDLSHAISNQQLAGDLIRSCGESVAESLNFRLHANTYIDAIDTERKCITSAERQYSYSKLVLATGANAFVPPMTGTAADTVITLNSLEEYEKHQDELHRAERVLVIGGGIIGSELAMDIATSGKQVVLVEPCESLMSGMLPDYIGYQLEKALKRQGAKVQTQDTVIALNRLSETDGIAVTLKSGREFIVDAAISAAGLVPNTSLANDGGITVNRGIVVDSTLQTSARDVYALGDCAEINGQVRAYLQPALLSANALAKTLLGQATQLVMPPMMVKVKTPKYPIQLGGSTISGVAKWQLDIDASGCSAKSYNEHGKLVGFVVTEEQTKQAFPLLKALSES
ncbi:NADH:flavorubredoxin reductase NorW [Photobacterium sanctipauli]|uniref:NADH:flavorubredoxin reductase NorW n=1 Tax=Photobacterium sanctipauli TaxID=1342794 RepID=A0A2T3NUB1_9GAMM|nr:NADH:flavorubredoxin reductase NorW [Photobacterium sanctipauli]PSW19805.1 NADH:flavorubredoxin reductase NorW [Photobacterium sanctipauli]